MPRYDADVDPRACTGSQMCVAIASHAFRYDDEALASVVTGGPFADDEDVRVAAESCPVEAITLTDADTGEQLFP